MEPEAAETLAHIFSTSQLSTKMMAGFRFPCSLSLVAFLGRFLLTLQDDRLLLENLYCCCETAMGSGVRTWLSCLKYTTLPVPQSIESREPRCGEA